MSQFRITYDGAALQTHEMDVRELAPALIAVGDLLDSATRAIHGDRVKAQTNVRGSFKTGSFGIDYSVAANWLLRVRDLLASDSASATANAIEILAFLGLVAWKGKHGLLYVLAWLRGRKIERVETGEQSAVLFVDDDSLQIELPVLDLLRDLAVREAVGRALAPLEHEGIDTFSAGTDTTIHHVIRKGEVHWYAPPVVEDELLIDDVRQMAFSIISLAFKDDNKWRLYDGAATIHATISDAGFLHRVDQNVETFAKGDVLVCRVRVRQWHAAQGARTEYEVVEVLEHRTGGRQMRLPGT